MPQKQTSYGARFNSRGHYVRHQAKRRGRKKPMKRTTRKGAYSRVAKKNMMIRRAPFVETKSKTSEEVRSDFTSESDHLAYTVYNTEHVHMNPTTFLLWKQGLQEHQCIGNSVYAKYLKMKLSFRFAQPYFSRTSGNAQIPMMPQRHELIWGFIRNPTNFTGHTDPEADECTINDLNEWINLRIVDYVNQQKDKLRYIPKASSTLTIVGRRMIKPDLRYNSSAPPTTTDATSPASDYAIGSIPDVDTSIYWPMNKKLHLQFSDNLTTTASGHYPNFQDLPFCVLVNWDYEDLPDGKQALQVPAIAYNDCIWYSDS